MVDSPSVLDVAMDESENIFRVPALSTPPTFSPYSYDVHRGSETPLIIDNGSSTLRYGFCTVDTPNTGPNIIARFKERKSNKNVLLFGDSVELDSTARSQARTPWEGDILVNFDALVSRLVLLYELKSSEGLLRDRSMRLTTRFFTLASMERPWPIPC